MPGGFTQITPGHVPVQICPPLGNGTTVTVYNSDPINVVTIGRDSSVSVNATNAAPLQPLTNGVFPSDKALYAVAPAGTAALVLIPDGGSLSPSPGQIALNIAETGLAKDSTLTGTTAAVNGVTSVLGDPAQDGTVAALPVGVYNQGVPLANKSSVLNQQTGTAVAANSTITLGPYVIVQPSYEISFQPVMTLNTNGEVWLRVTMTWSDVTTSLITAPPETWYVACSSGAGNVKVYGTGQAKGNQLTITVNNPNTAFGATLNNFVLMQNSVPRNRDDWRNSTSGFGGIPTYSVPSFDPDADVLFAVAPSVTAGTPVIRMLPLFAGVIGLAIVVPGSGGIVTISDLASVAGVTAGTLWQKVYSATATSDYVSVALPRVNCTLTIANTTGTNTWSVRAQIAQQLQ